MREYIKLKKADRFIYIRKTSQPGEVIQYYWWDPLVLRVEIASAAGINPLVIKIMCFPRIGLAGLRKQRETRIPGL